MKTLLRKNLLLVLVIGLAIFLRFYQLAQVPPSPSLDEVSIGYNAYSMLQTGKDEYGYSFPLLLRSYDDWRPAAYVYLVIPFIAVLGLDVVAVRLPSVILSLVTVMATYSLAKTLSSKTKYYSVRGQVISLPLVVTLLLAISPWHIYISRLGHEVNLGLTLVVLGLLFFVKAMQQRGRYLLLLSAICFSLSLYAYQSQKVIVPLVVLFLGLIFFKQLLQIKKQVILSLLLATALTIPIFLVSLAPEALIRLKGTSAFSTDHPRVQEYAIKRLESIEKGDKIGELLHNRRLVGMSIFWENYTSHFNPRWLFTNSGDERHKVPTMGVLYLWELPLIIVGIVSLFRSSTDRKLKLFILMWILISPIPGAITTDAPHVMRTMTFLPVWQVLGGYGLWRIFMALRSLKTKLLLGFSFITCVLVSLITLYENYFIIFPQRQSDSFQYALGKAMPFVVGQAERYDHIVFSNDKQLYQSYMFFLFYSQYDPKNYLREGGTISGGYAEAHQINNYRFQPMNGNEPVANTLYVTNLDEVKGGTIMKTFANKSGKDVIAVWRK